MKLSNVVMSAIMFMGVYAHADLKSEFSQVKQIVQTKANEVRNAEDQQAYEKAAQTRREDFRLREIEIRQKLRSEGIDITNLKLERSGREISWCTYDSMNGSLEDAYCNPEVENYYAKTGNTICQIRYQFQKNGYKKEISKNCYDATNPQPTEQDIRAVQPRDLLPSSR